LGHPPGQGLQFDLKLVEIPAAFLAQTIERHAQQSAFRGSKMIGADTRYVGKAEKLGRFDADNAVEHAVSLINQNRVAKSQIADGCGNLVQMGRLNLAYVAGWDDKVGRRTRDQRELRYQIVASGT